MHRALSELLRGHAAQISTAAPKRGTETEPEAHACCLCFFFFWIQPRSILLPSTEGMDGAGTSALLHSGVLSAPQAGVPHTRIRAGRHHAVPPAATKLSPSRLCFNVGHSHTRLGLGMRVGESQLWLGFLRGLPGGLGLLQELSNPGESTQRNSPKESEGRPPLGLPSPAVPSLLLAGEVAGGAGSLLPPKLLFPKRSSHPLPEPEPEMWHGES